MVTKGKFWQEEHFEGLKSTLNERMHLWNQSYTSRINPNSNLLPPLELFHYGSLHTNNLVLDFKYLLEISHVYMYIFVDVVATSIFHQSSNSSMLLVMEIFTWQKTLRPKCTSNATVSPSQA